MGLAITLILAFAVIGISILNRFEKWLETYNDSKNDK